MASLLNSITWNGSQGDLAVSYDFLPAGTKTTSDGDSYTAIATSDFIQQQFDAMFATISQYTNLTFSKGGATSDLRIMMTDDFKDDTDGFMNPPGEAKAGLGVFKAVPDYKFAVGAYNYMVMAHEVMHGLGLAHPHDDGGGSSIMRGVVESGDYGAFGLNQGVYTVMTYNNGDPTGDAAPDSGRYGYEVGPMALDVAVLQAKYGANMNWATGNTTYQIVGENARGTGWETIWDAGGTDKIAYQGDLDVTIDLHAASLKYAKGGGGYLSTADGIAGGFTIAKGVVIEKASGGAGDDSIRGNYADNDLRGHRGDDDLRGYRGDDAMRGGKGDDAMRGGGGADTMRGSAGRDLLKGGAGDDVMMGGRQDDRLLGGAGADTLTGGTGSDKFVFRNFGTVDHITDFQTGIDRIQLGGDVEDFRIVEKADGYFIMLDLDGDGKFHDGHIVSVMEVTASDIFL